MEVVVDWRSANAMPIYSMGQKKDLVNLQASQPDLGAREGHRADCLECQHVACTGQTGSGPASERLGKAAAT